MRRQLLVTLALSSLAVVIFVAYNVTSDDLASDSFAGYSYAIIGSSFMILATIGYTLSRRSRKRQVGQLNGSLQWHISFGSVAMVLLALHSFGNFNPRSGTYALYGMIALVISGIIGRIIDREFPKKIAREAAKAMTDWGDDRVTAIAQNMQAIATHNSQELQSFSARQPGNGNHSRSAQVAAARGLTPLPTSWDMAYISMEETPQEIERNSRHYRFVPDRRSALSSPGALMPGLNEQMANLQQVQQALQHERFYRAVIRYWRVFHVFLVLLTLGLTIWHLVYAAQLLIPTFVH